MAGKYLIDIQGVGENGNRSTITTPKLLTRSILYQTSINNIDSMFESAIYFINLGETVNYRIKNQLKILLYGSPEATENILKNEMELKAFDEALSDVITETENYQLWGKVKDSELRQRTELEIMHKIIDKWVQKIEFTTFTNFVYKTLNIFQKQTQFKGPRLTYSDATMLCRGYDHKTSPRKEIVKHIFEDNNIEWFVTRVAEMLFAKHLLGKKL